MRMIIQAAFAIMLLVFSFTTLAENTSQDQIDAILLYQRHTGGWPKNIDYSAPFDRAAVLSAKAETDSTIDNSATTEEMKLLAEAYSTTKNETYRTAFIKGLRYCLEAQYHNGGWPQRFPDTSGYSGQITFNDGAMIKVMELLKQIAEDNRYDFVAQELREQSKKAVQKGIACILKCQIIVDNRPTVWCAQHDRITYQPVKARSYELPSFSGSESVGVIRFLMSIEAPTNDIIQSIEGAIEWFKANEIKGYKTIRTPSPDSPKGSDIIVIADTNTPGMWARFYDLREISPIFCSRDGIPKRQLSEISYERRNGYSWYTTSPRALLTKHYPRWKKRTQN